MPPSEEPTDQELHGPPKPSPHAPNGLPNPFFARHKARLDELREACVVSQHGPRAELAEEAEWQSLPHMLRFFLLTYGGFEDPDDVLQRRWREYPDEERMAIRAALRTWRRLFEALHALTL